MLEKGKTKANEMYSVLEAFTKCRREKLKRRYSSIVKNHTRTQWEHRRGLGPTLRKSFLEK